MHNQTHKYNFPRIHIPGFHIPKNYIILITPYQTAPKGLQKMEMKRVEHEAKREVTFSKRKKGLFNKASELCELCGAEVALILFSPNLKPFTFEF